TRILRVLVPGIGEVGFDSAGSELLLESQAHDSRVSRVALLLAHSGGLVLGRVIEEHRWIPRAGVLVGRVLPDPGQDLVAMVVERLKLAVPAPLSRLAEAKRMAAVGHVGHPRAELFRVERRLRADDRRAG